jgi:hypothetical protein
VFKDGGDAQDEERKDDEANDARISVVVVPCSKYSQTIWLQKTIETISGWNQNEIKNSATKECQYLLKKTTKCKESLVISIDLILPSTFMKRTQMHIKKHIHTTKNLKSNTENRKL